MSQLICILTLIVGMSACLTDALAIPLAERKREFIRPCWLSSMILGVALWLRDPRGECVLAAANGGHRIRTRRPGLSGSVGGEAAKL